MANSKAVQDQDAVISEVEITAPPDRVFKALTDQKQLFTWWGKELSVVLTRFDMDGRKGGKYRYECHPAPGASHGEVGEQLKRNKARQFECHGEVLEYDPPRLLVWSWIANWHEHPDHTTTVRWELAPTATGTRVRVTHSGLSNEPISRKDYRQGWEGVLALLQGYFGSNPSDVIVP
jgi:uncharacterized protein YndB with AHSA1/START domain